MASEIRVNKITHTAGVGTITTSADGIVVAGIVTATTFSGNGANLTNLPAGQLTGTLPAISGSNLTGITGTTINNNADNRVITGSGSANTLNGEANLTFDGSILNINAGVPSLKLTDSDGGPCFHEVKGPGNGDLRISCDVGDSSSSGSEIQFLIHDSTKATIDSSGHLKFNSGYGSVNTAYGVRAWVSFNGTGTPAIRGDGGVSSVGDNDTGDYTVNFDNNMPDVNYAVGGLSENWEGTNADSYTQMSGYTGGATVGSYRFVTLRSRFDQQPPQKRDPSFVQLIFVR
tara:strand:- start:1081 stop:1944 length:864 start_codon:yes stop_codon:yes gene_type:complete